MKPSAAEPDAFFCVLVGGTFRSAYRSEYEFKIEEPAAWQAWKAGHVEFKRVEAFDAAKKRWYDRPIEPRSIGSTRSAIEAPIPERSGFLGASGLHYSLHGATFPLCTVDFGVNPPKLTIV